MQRAVVGPPGMSKEALAYYTELFKKAYDTADWQTYKTKQSLMGSFMAGDDLSKYWSEQLVRHEAILKASGAIK